MRQAVELAEAVVTHLYKDRGPVDNITLQRLLFLMDKQMSNGRKRRRPFPERFEPCAFGWYIPSVYYHFGSCWGAGAICMEFDVDPLTADELTALNYALNTLIGKGVYL